ncbi:MAG: FAD-binding oxidoreductase [Nevskia sp.]|nr:FAD-binding oxidoreductase [Nevskia sp.]
MNTAESLRALLGPRYIDERDRLQRYEIPERGEPGHTSCALLPASEAELQQVLRLCNELKQKLVISAGRTGLVESQRPEGEAVLSLERLNRPLRFELADGRVFEFAPEASPEQGADALAAWWRDLGQPALTDARIEVQAGMAVDAVNEMLRPLSLMWPMEMGSTSAATVGACVANASAGANAVCYGTAAHLCETAWGYWGDGSAAGPCTATVWEAPKPSRLAVDSANVQPAWGLIGSQGLFGVVSRVRLRTCPLPAQREAVLLPVQDMPEAMRLLEFARDSFPGDVEEFEFMGRPAIELVREHQGAAFRWPFESQQIDAPFYLLLQVKSQDAEEDLAGELYDFLAGILEWPAERIGYAPLPVLKKLRHSITESSNARMRALGGGRLSFDTATPVAGFGEYLSDLERTLKAAHPQVQFVAFGHAGVGGAHLHLLGTREHPVAAHAAELVRLVFDVTQRHHGTFSAEHGVGPKWAGEFRRRAPERLRQALVDEKRRRDPNGILSPRSFGLLAPC